MNCLVKEANTLIRTKDLCKDCFELIKRDNKKRRKAGFNITRDLNILCENCGDENSAIEFLSNIEGKKSVCRKCFKLLREEQKWKK